MKKDRSKVAAAVAPKPVAPVAAPPVVTLTHSTKERKGSSVVFLIPGVRGTVIRFDDGADGLDANPTPAPTSVRNGTGADGERGMGRRPTS